MAFGSMIRIPSLMDNQSKHSTNINHNNGCAVTQAVSCQPTVADGFMCVSGHVGSVVAKVALGQFFCKYLSFPCNSYRRLLHTHHHTHPSSRAGTKGQIVADVPSGLSLIPPQEEKKKTLKNLRGYSVGITADRNLRCMPL
jgi:hypothetical protein